MSLLLKLRRRSCCPHWLLTFLLLSWLHVLIVSSGYSQQSKLALVSISTLLFNVSAWMFYSMLYLLPMLLSTQLLKWVGVTKTSILQSNALLWSVFVLVSLHSDRMLYQLYHFHLNSFVWNLLWTPGGVSSLGISNSTRLSVIALIAQIFSLQALALVVSRYGLLLCWRGNWGPRVLLFTFLTFILQGAVYGLSDLQHFGPILEGANSYPLFQRVRFRKLARKFGYEYQESTAEQLHFSQAALRYPLTPVQFAPVTKPPNIIFLVAESLRWDQLSPVVMPNTWQFATQHHRFANHYSSGNGTREALFGMFYGLYGSYWEQFLHARQSPLLMDRLQALNYQMDIRTSATFTYPEFDKTLFVNVPKQQLSESGDELPPWQRDQQNMDALLQFLEQRDSTRPFMSFFFLESTHASYSFPAETALYPDYLHTVDYLSIKKLDDDKQALPLLHRYSNAAYWIDQQLQRLYQELAEQQLLESTIVIFTGDHGEEFMEKGSWGHNSSFVEEQTHVPLVLALPGQQAAVFNSATSHLDIGTTLLQLLGAQGPTLAYSLGENLYTSSTRQHLVLSDWHSISIQTADLKYRIPYLQQNIEYWQPTDLRDQALPVNEAESLVEKIQPLVLETMRNFSMFNAKQ